MKQHFDLCQRIIEECTGKRCSTMIDGDLTYDVANNRFPLITITTRRSYWKSAISQVFGYYDNAADFRASGTKNGMLMRMKTKLG